jgi:hypothetical protein
VYSVSSKLACFLILIKIIHGSFQQVPNALPEHPSPINLCPGPLSFSLWLDIVLISLVVNNIVGKSFWTIPSCVAYFDAFAFIQFFRCSYFHLLFPAPSNPAAIL